MGVDLYAFVAKVAQLFCVATRCSLGTPEKPEPIRPGNSKLQRSRRNLAAATDLWSIICCHISP